MAAYRNQREQIEHLEAFINRFRYQATKAKQVQSRIKELEKIERIEIPEEEPVIHFKFPQPPPSGRIVVEAEGSGQELRRQAAFSPTARFTIERGDRVALVGVNGAGKSTLIKLLTGDEAPTAGTIQLGHNVVAEYFRAGSVQGARSRGAHARRHQPRRACAFPRSTLRSLLGCFLFSGDDVFKPLGVLSAASATATRWRAFWSRLRIFCSSTSPPTTSTCAPKTCCSRRSPPTPAPWFLSPTTAISSIAWPRACSKSRTAPSPPTKATTKITCAAKRRSRPNAGARRPRKRSGVPKLRLPSPLEEDRAVDFDPPREHTIVIEGGFEPRTALRQKTTRRLNPIKQKQMEDRCAFLEEEIPRVEASIAHTEEHWASTSPPRKPSA